MRNATLKNNKGFSLVELIIVIAILAVLAAIIAPAIQHYVVRARKVRAIEDSKTIVRDIEDAQLSEKLAMSDAIPFTKDGDKTIQKGTYFAALTDRIQNLNFAPLIASLDISVNDVQILALENDRSGIVDFMLSKHGPYYVCYNGSDYFLIDEYTSGKLDDASNGDVIEPEGIIPNDQIKDVPGSLPVETKTSDSFADLVCNDALWAKNGKGKNIIAVSNINSGKNDKGDGSMAVARRALEDLITRCLGTDQYEMTREINNKKKTVTLTITPTGDYQVSSSDGSTKTYKSVQLIFDRKTNQLIEERLED